MYGAKCNCTSHTIWFDNICIVVSTPQRVSFGMLGELVEHPGQLALHPRSMWMCFSELSLVHAVARSQQWFSIAILPQMHKCRCPFCLQLQRARMLFAMIAIV